MTISHEDIRDRSHNRPFDKKAHRDSDARGKIALAEFLQQRNCKILLNPDESNKAGCCLEYYDIAYIKNDIQYKADAEVREGWWRNGRHHIGFDEISQPARKFRKDYDNVDFLFSFSDDLNGVYIIDKTKVQEAIENKSSCVRIVEKHAEGQLEPFIYIDRACQGELFHYFIKGDSGLWKENKN